MRFIKLRLHFLPCLRCELAQLMLWNDVADTFDKSCRIELRANDLVRAVGENGHTPVADKSYQLTMLSGLDLRAQMFRFADSGLSFNIDQHKIVRPRPEHGQPLDVAESGIYLEARDAKNLITQRPQHLAPTDVKNRLFIACE